MTVQLIEILDSLGTDVADFAVTFATLSASPQTAAVLGEPFAALLRDVSPQNILSNNLPKFPPFSTAAAAFSNNGNNNNNKDSTTTSSSTVRESLAKLTDTLIKAAGPTAQAAKPSPELVEAVRTIQILNKSSGFETDKLALVVRKVLREPVMQSIVARVLSELSERAATRLVRRIFGTTESAGTGVGSRGSNQAASALAGAGVGAGVVSSRI